MPRKQVSFQQIMERLEAIKVRLHNNKESHKQAIAFRNYASLRFFLSNVYDMFRSLREWCNTLEQSGIDLWKVKEAVAVAEYILTEAVEKELERLASQCGVERVYLPTYYTPDDLVNFIERVKQLFYDYETFRKFDADGFFDGYNYTQWRLGKPFIDYAIQVTIQAARELKVGGLPLPAYFFDDKLEALVIDFYGWLEILPLSDWQYEERCRRREISKDDNESGE